ncbi:MAG TPA: ChaN family lipoprotein [Geobacteraceae bacterium]|nr:ChaN family lipoprotein [Geobacteraceae bacterium]
MNRFFLLLCLAALAPFIVTGCSHGGNQLMGDPQNPYPLTSPPKVGEIVHLPTGTLVTPAQMLAVAGDARIVYLGETHDNPASHRLELEVLQGLAGLHPGRQALGMEMFVRSQQPALDRWVAGELDEKAFIKESRWYENWQMDFAYYRDLLKFARDRRIPVIALNAEKSLVAAVRTKSPDQLSATEKAQLPELDLTDPYQRGLVAAIFGEHSHGGLQIDGFVRAQTVWDETMAESAARYLASPAGRDKHLLVVAGGNHVSNGFGIPRRVFRRLPASYVLIGGQEINIQPEKQNRLMDVTLPEFPMVPFDFLVYLSYEDLPETGVRLGVMMEPETAGRGLTVKSVASGSNAERAGLKPGDLLLAIDGEALAESFDLIYAVKRKHPGDHGTLKIERQGRTLEVDVLFQSGGKAESAPKR